MTRIATALIGCCTVLVPVLSPAPAQAQATRTWVSGVGDDANPCSRTAPCKTFPGAISKTATSGEINCLDPGGFGGVTITKSITIDCHEILAGVLVAGTNAIIINAGAGDTVKLRNLNIMGLRTGLVGVTILAAKAVFLDDLQIHEFSQQGVKDVRTTATGKLYIRNSIIRDNAGAGVAVAGTGNPRVDAVIEDSHLNGNAFGVAVGAFNAVMVARSVMTGNTAAGVLADPSGVISVDNSTITSNGIGVRPSAYRRCSCPTTTSPSTAPASAARPRRSATTGSIRWSAPRRPRPAPTPTTRASSNRPDATFCRRTRPPASTRGGRRGRGRRITPRCEPPRGLCTLVVLAATLLQAGRLAEAEDQFKRALHQAPANGWSYYGLVQLYKARGAAAAAAQAEAQLAKTWAGDRQLLQISKL